MALTKSQLEALKNTLLASQQPIDASTHRAFVQNVIDEMYDAQSRGDLLAGVQTDGTTASGDTILLIRSGEMFLVPSSLFVGSGTLAALSDVVIIDEQEGDILSYNAVEGVWENIVASSLISDNVLLRTTNQSFTGIKSAVNTGSSQINGLSLINSGGGFFSKVFVVTNTSTGTGIVSNNLSSGFGIDSQNTSSGSGIFSANSSTGNGIRSTNSSTGNGIFSHNTSTGTGINSLNGSTGSGILSNNNSTGSGINSQNNLTGTGINSNNISTGIGIRSNNNLTGIGILSNGSLAATGFNYVGQNNNVNTFTVDKFGAITGLTGSLSGDLSAGKLLAGLPVGWVTSNLLEVNGSGKINGNLEVNGSLSILGTGSFTSAVTAPTFIGALTGVASGNLALSGGTVTGAVNFNERVRFGGASEFANFNMFFQDIVVGNGDVDFNLSSHSFNFGTIQIFYFDTSTGNVQVNNGLFGSSAIFTGSVTASSFPTSSDIRLKDLVEPYDYTQVADLNPITFKYKNDSDDLNHYGYSAQDILVMMPHAVIENEDGFLSVNYTEVLVAKVKYLEDKLMSLELILNQLQNQTI